MGTKSVYIQKDTVDKKVMEDLRNKLLADIMTKSAEIHNDWIDVFKRKMDHPTAIATITITVAATLAMAASMQARGMDEVLNADHTLHYQALLQVQNDVKREIDKVRPLCPVADKIDQFREDNDSVEIGAVA